MFFWHAGTKRLEYQSTLKLLDNFQYLPGLSEETWDLMVSEVSNTHQALFATLQDSEADPEDFGKYNANVPLRKRRHLNDKTMMASSRGTEVALTSCSIADRAHHERRIRPPDSLG